MFNFVELRHNEKLRKKYNEKVIDATTRCTEGKKLLKSWLLNAEQNANGECSFARRTRVAEKGVKIAGKTKTWNREMRHRGWVPREYRVERARGMQERGRGKRHVTFRPFVSTSGIVAPSTRYKGVENGDGGLILLKRLW